MRLGRFLEDTGAAAAAELALILPGIAFVLLNVVDLSSYIWSRMQVDLAAHEAVGFVRAACSQDDKIPATYPATNCKADLSGDMTEAAQSVFGAVSLAETEEAYYCAGADGELVQVAVASGTPPTNCNGTVTGSTSAPGVYIKTTASYAYSPVFPGASVASLLTTPITRTAWLRLK
jgi:Flp pilus assembly protein TadG